MSDTMLAAVYYAPNDLRVESRPIPTLAPGEALLKVESATICGTDLRILGGGHRYYGAGVVRVPGHEVVGRIVAVADDTVGVSVGTRVFVAPNMAVGFSRQAVRGDNNLSQNFAAFGITQDGAFAEYLRIPSAAILQGNLIPIGETVDGAATALIEPFACVLRGQKPLHIDVGEVVVVMGAGPIGTMHVMLAKLHGAGHIIVSEPQAERRTQVLAFGADIAVPPDELAAAVQAASGGNGADAIIVATPVHAALEAATGIAAIGGRINFFGGLPKDKPTIALDANAVHYKELIVTGTTACSTADCHQAAAIVLSGRVNLGTMVNARYPLHEALAAFEAAKDRLSLKIAIEP
jgi:L-iditol 2-dehydrogenase